MGGVDEKGSREGSDGFFFSKMVKVMKKRVVWVGGEPTHPPTHQWSVGWGGGDCLVGWRGGGG